MRVLDKNVDFYDYMSHRYPDDTMTFDRTNSFKLTKELLCRKLWSMRFANFTFILLQVCNTFWLFVVEITKTDDWGHIVDCNINLVKTWKDYNKPNCLINLKEIAFPSKLLWKLVKSRTNKVLDTESLTNLSNVIIDFIARGEYSVRGDLSEHTVYRGNDYANPIVRSIPILAPSGMAKLIDPMEIYLSLEEYFSAEKTRLERTESIGLTDIGRIENHGFDTKHSFRGK